MNTRRLWLSADFGKLWLGQGISALGSSVSDLALPTLAVLSLQGGPFEVGLLAALQKVPFPFVSLVAGVFVDKPILISGEDRYGNFTYLPRPTFETVAEMSHR